MSETTCQQPTGFLESDANQPRQARWLRHKYVLAIQSLLDGDAEALGRKAIELALEGDTVALRLCLERIVPPRKDSPVEFALPTVSNAAEAAKAAGEVLQAVSESVLTPLEATTVMGLVERYGRVLEYSEFEGRIVALERATTTKSA